MESTKRSRSGQRGLAGLCRSTCRQRASAMSAMPSGAPGCPERAFSMASTARIRRALAHCLRVGMKRFLHCCFLRMGKGGQAAAALRRSLEQIPLRIGIIKFTARPLRRAAGPTNNAEACPTAVSRPWRPKGRGGRRLPRRPRQRPPGARHRACDRKMPNRKPAHRPRPPPERRRFRGRPRRPPE